MKGTLILAVSLGLSAFVAAASEQLLTFGSRDVSIMLVNHDGAAEPNSPAVGIELVSVTVAKQASDRLPTLLRANGIYPNADSFQMFYELNPDIKDFASVTLGTPFRIPKANRTTELNEWLHKGYLVRVFTDVKLRDRLVKNIDHVEGSGLRFSALDPSVFGGVEKKTLLAECAQDTIGHLQDIRTLVIEDVWPLSTEFLRQLDGDVRLFRLALERSASTGVISVADQERIDLIHQDVMMKVGALSASKSSPGEPAPRYPEAVVEVAVNPMNSPEIKALRICYVTIALADEPDSYQPSPSTGAPQTFTLSLAKYKVWAAKDEKCRTVTDQAIVSVDGKDKKQHVDVWLIR